MHGNSKTRYVANSECGFTLFETLVALTIGSIMIGLCYEFFGQTQTISRAAQNANFHSEAFRAFSIIEAPLERAQLIKIEKNIEGEWLAFSGKPTLMRFNSVTRIGAEYNGLREITIRSSKTQSGYDLIWEVRSISSKAVQFSKTLLHSLTTIRFEYAYVSEIQIDRIDWQPSFSASAQLPSAVRISLEKEVHGKAIKLRSIFLINQH